MAKLKSIPIRKTYVVSEHNVNPQNKTNKKVKLKSAKETFKSYERIASNLVEENSIHLRRKLESYCSDLISKSFSELKHDILQVESTLSARILQLESKFNKFDGEFEKLNLKFESIKNDLTKGFSNDIEIERGKRLTMLKKIQSQYDILAGACEKRIAATTQESMSALSTIQQEVNAHTRDINNTREKVDEMLLKRYGFVPGKRVSSENLSSSFNQGLDAGLIMDNLAGRIKELELRVLESELQSDEKENVNVSVHKLKNSLSRSPSRRPAADPEPSGSLSPSLSLLSYQVRECQREIRSLQDRHRSSEIEAAVAAERDRDRDRGRAAAGGGRGVPQQEDAASLLSEEVKALRRKLKRLAENTTRACRSLSGGLSDVQQATLNLYSWADKAHESFGLISDQLSLATNVCPRAKIYNPAARNESQIIPPTDF